MHVCFVLTTPFALNAFVGPAIKALLAQGWRVTVLVNTRAGRVSDEIAQGAEVIHLDIERNIAPFSDIQTLRFLLKLFSARRFDIVHSVTPKAGLLAMLAACIVGIKVRIHTFTGQVWTTRRGVMQYLLRTLDRVLARCATALLVDSPSQREFLADKKIALLQSLYVLGEGSITGVDTKRFSPNAAARHKLRAVLNISADAAVLLYVGRMARDKGIAELVRAFATVAMRFEQARLLLVGPDEGVLEAALALAGEFRGRIDTAGLTQQPEIFMAAADIFCLASHREGFGLSLIEAGSCGLPSVAYQIYGVTDAVANEVTGYLVPLRDENAFAGAICKLIEAPGRREAMGRAARQRAERDFSQHVLVQRWLDFYDGQLALVKTHE